MGKAKAYRDTSYDDDVGVGPGAPQEMGELVQRKLLSGLGRCLRCGGLNGGVV